MAMPRLTRRRLLQAAMALAGAATASGCHVFQPAPTPTPVVPPRLVFAHPAGREFEPMAEFVGQVRAQNRLSGVEIQDRAILGDYYAVLAQEVAGGTGPDLFIQPDEILPDWVSQGHLMALDAFLATDTTFDLSDFYPQSLGYVRFRGQLWALPWICSPSILLVNRDLFAAAGVPEPLPGWTWEDFREAALALTDAEQNRWAMGPMTDWYQFAERIWQNGGEVFSLGRDRCLLAEPAALDAMDYWVSLMLDGGIVPAESSWGSGNWRLFRSGRVAIMENTLYYVTAFQQAPMKIGLAALPARRNAACLLTSGSLAITARCQHPREAWELLKLLTSAEALTAISRVLHVPCARRSANEQLPYADAALPVDWSLVMPAVESGRLLEVVPHQQEVQALLETMAGDIMHRRQTVREAVNATVPLVNELVAGGFGQ